MLTDDEVRWEIEWIEKMYINEIGEREWDLDTTATRDFRTHRSAIAAARNCKPDGLMLVQVRRKVWRGNRYTGEWEYDLPEEVEPHAWKNTNGIEQTQ